MLKKIIEKIKKHRYKILAAASFVAAGYFLYCTFNDQKNVKLSTFFQALKNDQINDVIIKGQIIYFRSLTSGWYYSLLGNYPLYQLFNQIKAMPNVTFSCESQMTAASIIPIAAPLIGLFMMYKLMPKQYGKQIYKRQIKANTIEHFDSFYGGDRIKNYLKQAIQFMKNPEQFQKFGLRIRRGILLHGPPGTGKTMLARILANQAGLQFFSASASEFQQIFVGVGPKRIRDIFQKARSIQKGAIIFIDEIDAIGSRNQHWQTKQQRSTINQLLTQIDGFTQNSKIFLIGATNNIKLVDQALLRPGRFDLKIYIAPPNQNDRVGILKTLIKSKHMPCMLNDQQLQKISRITDGWCGADLQSLLNQSGYQAIRKSQNQITFKTISQAVATRNKMSS